MYGIILEQRMIFMKTTLKPKAQQLFDLVGFNELTTIQSMTYNKINQHKDLIVQSATGSGKTHSFLFPLMDSVDSSKHYTQALIIAPTRELAMQIHKFASDMKKVDDQLKISLLIGGKDKLSSPLDAQIVIGTPGRLQDEFSNGMLLAQNVKTIVLDEADMIWEYGFIDELADILHRISKPVQLLVFSATIPDELKLFMKKEMVHPETITNKEKSDYNPKITHILIQNLKQKPTDIILDLMKQVQMSGLILFLNTREEAAQLSDDLSSYGVDVLELHGDMTPRKRKQTLTRLFDQKHFVLVATDIAARGLDLPHVSHVISIGLPSHLDFYFHRAGRSSRAGMEGTSIVLVNQSHKDAVDKLTAMGIDFNYKKLSEQGLSDARKFYEKKVYHKKTDPEVAQILNRKKVQVKPNYKKKRKQAISDLERKKRREMIQREINAQKKERAKARSKSNHS